MVRKGRSMRPRTLRRLLVPVAAVLGLSLASSTAAAQRSPRHRPYFEHHAEVVFVPYGLYVGAGLVGTRILHQRGEPELLDDGGGLVVFAGLRLSQRLALEMGWLATFHNPETIETTFGPETDYLVLNGFTGDAKIYLGPDRERVEAYLQGGVGLYLLDSSYVGTESIGTGFQAGGGIDFHLGSHVDFGLRALYRGIAMGPPNEDEDDTYISALSGEANLTLRF
jgi:Outer membrane protein beta-barrel domain